MFTGIVETTGQVVSARKNRGGSRRLVVSSTMDMGRVPLGASVAVNGVCLTVVARKGKQFEADVGPETMALTTLGGVRKGSAVHLERPLRMGAELGGHLVSGHVDGLGTLVKRKAHGDALELCFRLPAALSDHLATKGSIAIDGVSLTVNKVKGRKFWVTLVPHTLEVTFLGELAQGDHVNIETDLIAKHIVKLVKRHG